MWQETDRVTSLIQTSLDEQSLTRGFSFSLALSSTTTRTDSQDSECDLQGGGDASSIQQASVDEYRMPLMSHV